MNAKQDSYGSRFLYVEDLLIDGKYQSPSVTISDVHPPHTLTAADGRTIDKWSLSFEGKEKILVLCKTNCSIVHFVTGNPPGPKWVGVSLRLEARVVEAFGEMVPAIRVIPPKGTLIRRNLIKRLGTKAEWTDARRAAP